jgi:hypothetical protein
LMAAWPSGPVQQVCDVGAGVVEQVGEHCRISFAISAMSPIAGWVSARLVATVTAKKACASIARMVERCHDVRRRTWCSSRPVNPYLLGKTSSTVHRRPATLARVDSCTGVGV